MQRRRALPHEFGAAPEALASLGRGQLARIGLAGERGDPNQKLDLPIEQLPVYAFASAAEQRQ
jgi:hypothetical protein